MKEKELKEMFPEFYPALQDTRKGYPPTDPEKDRRAFREFMIFSSLAASLLAIVILIIVAVYA